MEPVDTGLTPQSPSTLETSTGGVESDQLISTKISSQLMDDNAETLQQHSESDMKSLSAVETVRCAICLDDLTPEDESELFPCQHKEYHFRCISYWLYLQGNKKSCPLCKARLTGTRWIEDGEPMITFFVPQQPSALVYFNTDAALHEATRTWESQQSSLRPRPHRMRPPHRWHFSGRLDLSAVESNRLDLEEDIEIRLRRKVYRDNTYSMHVGSSRTTGYREITPAMFRTDEELVMRARAFIRRELKVFSFLQLADTDTMIPMFGGRGPDASLFDRRRMNAEFLLNYTLAMLKQVDMKGSTGQAEDMMADFLGRQYARLFLHELRSWLRSPCPSLPVWDSSVQYLQQTGSATNLAEQSTTSLREADSSSESRETGQPSGNRGQSEASSSRDRSRSSRGDFYRPIKSGRIERNRQSRSAAMRGFHRRPLDDQSREFWGLRR